MFILIKIIYQIKPIKNDTKRNTILRTFGKEGRIGTNDIRNVQGFIRQSKYAGARNEGDASQEAGQQRFYDRSNFFKKYEKQVENIAIEEFLLENYSRKLYF